eukprot:COSAG04_NODE_13486_length_604_cov_0.976238_1_plen_200_part_01
MEVPAIQSRILLGAAAWQTKIDQYLYYGLDGWRQYYRGYTPEGSGAWVGRNMTSNLDLLDFRNQGAGHDGEGLVLVPGPPISRYRGILTTLHVENLRDGLEDYECLVLLRSLLEQAKGYGLEVSAEASALTVSPFVVDLPPPAYPDGRRRFTEDPAVVKMQWRVVAEAIESVQTKLQRAKAERAAAKSDDEQTVKYPNLP